MPLDQSKNTRASTEAPSKADAPQESPVLEGELLLERLFVEQPTRKTGKFAARAAAFARKVPRAKVSPGISRPSLFGRLFRTRGAADPRAEVRKSDAPSTPNQAHTSAPPSSAASKPPVEAKPQRAGARLFTRDPKERFLVVEIGGNRALFWRLTTQGVEAIEALPAGAAAMSFSREDYRFESESRLAQRQAETLVLQEVGDAVQVINRTRDLGAVYATPRSRVESMPYRLGPGPMLVDRLVRERIKEPQALIVGLELKDPGGRAALLILYFLSASGRGTAPQISVYPENRDFLLSQFAATHQAARESAQVLLLDHTALLSVAHELTLYPNEPMVGAIAVRKLWSLAMSLTLASAVLTGGWAYREWTQHESARRALAQAQEMAQRSERQNNALLESSPRALAKALTVDVPDAFARAQAVWLPGARVQLSVEGSGTELTITLPLFSARPGGHRNVPVPAEDRAIDSLLALQAPPGCTRGALSFSGTLNEAQLSIRCEAPPQPLARYRDG